MHEYSIALEIFDIVNETIVKEELSNVKVIKLKIGKLTAILPELLTDAFDTISECSDLKDVKLEIVEVPVRIKCRKCGCFYEPDELQFFCTRCGGSFTELVTGNELIIESIEVEKNGYNNS